MQADSNNSNGSQQPNLKIGNTFIDLEELTENANEEQVLEIINNEDSFITLLEKYDKGLINLTHKYYSVAEKIINSPDKLALLTSDQVIEIVERWLDLDDASNYQALCENLNAVQLTSIASKKSKAAHTILSHQNSLEKFNDEQLKLIAIRYSKKDKDAMPAKIILSNQTLYEKLKAEQLTDIAFCHSNIVEVILSNLQLYEKLDDWQVADIIINCTRSEIAEKILLEPRRTFTHRKLTEIAIKHSRAAKIILSNEALYKQLVAKQLTDIAVKNFTAAKIILSNYALYDKLNNAQLTEIAIKHSRAAKIILSNEALYKQLNAEQLRQIAVSDSFVVEIILSNYALYDKLNNAQLTDIAVKSFSAAKIIVSNEPLYKQLNAKQLTDIAVMNFRAAEIIVSNEPLYKQLNTEQFTLIAVTHSSAAEIIVSNEALYKQLNAEQLTKIAVCHSNAAKIILTIIDIAEKLSDGHVKTIKKRYPSEIFYSQDELIKALQNEKCRFAEIIILLSKPDYLNKIHNHISALHIAASRASLKKDSAEYYLNLLELMLQQGADPNIRGTGIYKGEKPIAWIKPSSSKKLAITNLLKNGLGLFKQPHALKGSGETPSTYRSLGKTY